jgi:hypothetical protein
VKPIPFAYYPNHKAEFHTEHTRMYTYSTLTEHCMCGTSFHSRFLTFPSSSVQYSAHISSAVRFHFLPFVADTFLQRINTRGAVQKKIREENIYPVFKRTIFRYTFSGYSNVTVIK